MSQTIPITLPAARRRELMADIQARQRQRHAAIVHLAGDRADDDDATPAKSRKDRRHAKRTGDDDDDPDDPPLSAIDRAIAAAPAAMRGKERVSTGVVMETLHCARGSIWKWRREGRLSDPLYSGQRQATWLISEILEILEGTR